MSLAIGDGDRAQLVGLALTGREMALHAELIAFEILECAGVFLFATATVHLERRTHTRLTVYRLDESGAWHVSCRLPSRSLPSLIDAATATLGRLEVERRIAS